MVGRSHCRADGANPRRTLPVHARWQRTGVHARDWQDQQFHVIDLETVQERRLSNLKPGFTLRSFDVSPDGTQIVFDRVRENADLVLIDLKQPSPR
jgi:hypothetical protein